MGEKAARFDQLNIVVADIEASANFYGRLGVRFETPGPAAFHLNGAAGADLDIDLDTAAFAAIWNPAWAGREDLVGRVVIGFRVQARDAVDSLHADLTG